MPAARTVAVQAVVRGGVLYEPLGHPAGLTHFVEHLILHGTREYPSSAAFNGYLEDHGITVSAATQRDNLTLQLTCLPEFLPIAVRALSGLCTRAHMPGDAAYETERSVVTEEVLDTTNEDGYSIDPDEILKARQFGPAAGRPVAGTLRDVAEYRHADALAWYRRLFTGANMTVLIAGAVNPTYASELVAQEFRGLPKGTPPTPYPTAVRSDVPILLQRDTSAQAACIFSWTAPGVLAPQHAEADLALRVLDTGFSSRMYQALMECSGLVYNVSTDADCYPTFGTFDIHASFAPDKLEDVVSTLDVLLQQPVTKTELHRARMAIMVELEERQNSPTELLSWYRTWLPGHATPADYIKQLSRLSLDSVQHQFQAVFHTEPSVVVVGPVSIRRLSTLFGRPVIADAGDLQLA